MKQKVVIKISLEGLKSRSKALQTAVSFSGVESVGWKGDDMSELEVTGDGMDAVKLTALLRKKVGPAEIVSVGPAGGENKEEKKDQNKPEEPEVKELPIPYFLPYQGGVPPYEYRVVTAEPYPYPCRIL